ncbi:MAG TPA: hypothetical protein VMR45_00835 [Patescibacteria group bacterium]|jgi:hypothetical protein|nr:hypothetical protein [Patescibacteria group bacterium]
MYKNMKICGKVFVVAEAGNGALEPQPAKAGIGWAVAYFVF